MLQWLLISLILLFSLEPVKQQETDASETLDNINKALGKVVDKSNTQLRELQSLRKDLTSLKDSVRRLNDSLIDLSSSLAGLNYTQADFQDSIAELSNVVVGLNDSVRGLHEEHKEQTATTDTNTQQVNTKLNTLISDLSQHQQQTAADSAQFQTSFTQLHKNLTNNLTYQLETIQQYLESDPSLLVHTCGGTGGWRRVVYLDMTDPSTTCPSGWQLTEYISCGRASNGSIICDSVSFPVTRGEYSKVCGRIKAYQRGSPDAFYTFGQPPTVDLNSVYVDGVSVIHGNPHQHIWTFAAGVSQNAFNCPRCACPCESVYARVRIIFVSQGSMNDGMTHMHHLTI